MVHEAFVSHIYDQGIQICKYVFFFFLKKGFTLLDTGFFLRNLSCELNQKSEPEARVNLWLTALGQMSYLKCVTHSGVACDGRVTCLGFLQVWEEVQHGGACNGMAVWARFKPEPWTRVRNLVLKPSHKCKVVRRKNKPGDSKCSRRKLSRISAMNLNIWYFQILKKEQFSWRYSHRYSAKGIS